VRGSREAIRTHLVRVQALFALAIGLGIAFEASSVDGAAPLSAAIAEVQPKCVKIYGAGGFRGLEAYQSGFLISAEGHVLTAHSYVLDADYITCTLDDGQKFEAKFIGADPRLEVAVLKIEGKDLPHFDLTKAASAAEGTAVLAFSNLFGVAVGDEPVSVLHGVVAAITSLDARRGVFQTMYNGPVLVVDTMTNNPGAAGGVLTNTRGELLGMLGKELRNARNNTWLNYAIPISELTETIDRIRAGKAPPVGNDRPDRPLANPLTLEALGIVMVPAVLERTPPFVDKVRAGSPAARAGIAADDIVLFVDEQLIQSSQSFVKVLERIEINEPLRLTVMRKTKIVDVTIELTDQEVTAAVIATKSTSGAESTTKEREK
jgi:serine protease Do